MPRTGRDCTRSGSCIYGLALRLAANQLLDLLLIASARSRPLRFRGSLLARGALYFLPFQLVFNLGGVRHCKFLIPQKNLLRPARETRGPHA